jgi:hypothetical protein
LLSRVLSTHLISSAAATVLDVFDVGAANYVRNTKLTLFDILIHQKIYSIIAGLCVSVLIPYDCND